MDVRSWHFHDIGYLLFTVNSEIFARLFFANRDKRHSCDVKISRLGHDLPIPSKDRVIVQNRKDFIFTIPRICEVSRK